MRVVGRNQALYLCLLLGGCARPSAPTAAHQSIVDTNNPVFGPSIFGAIPGLGLNGVVPGAAAAAITASDVHGGVYSNGVDTAVAPGGDFAAWLASASGVPFSSTTAFVDRLNQTRTAAQTEMGKLNPAYVLTAMSLIGALPGADVSIPSNPTLSFSGYQPLRARWMKSQYLPAAGDDLFYQYADPSLFQEIRERGARLYCAARRAAFMQNATGKYSMGKQVAFGFKIFGQQIDFGVIEPTVIIDGPERYLGAGAVPPNDGAQAFHVPFLFGTRITPISLLPGLGEVRYPVVLSSGDSEVRTKSDYRTIFIGGAPVDDYSRNYQTVTHADAISAAGEAASAKVTFPLFNLGILHVDLGLQMDFGLGSPYTVDNDRLLAPSGWLPFAVGTPIRTGNWSDPYHDYNWQAISATNFSIVGSPPIMNLPMDANAPFLIRAYENDDHHVAGATLAGLGGSLSGGVGVNWGPIEVSLDVVGGLDGHVSLKQDIRDAALATPIDLPLSAPLAAVTVMPRSHAEANLGAHVEFHFKLSLFIGSIDYRKTIVDFGTQSIANWDKDWPEASRLRLGYGAPEGDPMKLPAVNSHLPGGGPYGSFPPDVDACLAENTANPPVPPECDPRPPTSSPPQANVCVYSNTGTGGAPPNICADIETYITTFYGGSSPLQQQCARDTLIFVCSPVSKQQVWEGNQVIAHIVDLANSAQANQFASIVQSCRMANPSGPPDTWFKNTFGFAACDNTATLLNPNDIITKLPPPISDPPPITPSGC